MRDLDRDSQGQLTMQIHYPVAIGDCTEMMGFATKAVSFSKEVGSYKLEEVRYCDRQ